MVIVNPKKAKKGVKKAMASEKVLKIVNEKIISKMEKGVNPWVKPWACPSNDKFDPKYLAGNYFTNEAYHGINQILLDAGYYLTFRQVQELGGKVKKGAKGQMVIYCKWLQKTKINEAGEQTNDGAPYPTYMYSNVFKIEDTEGCRVIKRTSTKIDIDTKPCELNTEGESIINNYKNREGINIKILLQDSAYYSPMHDEIILPMLQQFSSEKKFYSTAFHEIAHSTGACTRLNRDIANSFGTQKYSKEELIAEITSCYVMNSLGIATDNTDSNSAAYIKNWAEHLKRNNSAFIISAMSQAEKAFNYIMNGKAKKVEV